MLFDIVRICFSEAVGKMAERSKATCHRQVRPAGRRRFESFSCLTAS